jgi:hypothetical protein
MAEKNKNNKDSQKGQVTPKKKKILSLVGLTPEESFHLTGKSCERERKMSSMFFFREILLPLLLRY